MGVYSLDELVRRWQTGDLTAEQAIGQLLLLIKELAARVTELERMQARRPPGESRLGSQGTR
jgi:hypothetical protein